MCLTMNKIKSYSKQIWLTATIAVLLFAGIVAFPANKAPQIVSAEGIGSIMITSSYDDTRGRTASLAVLVSEVEDAAAGSFELHYDSDVGYVTGVDKGDMLPSDSIFIENTEKARDGVMKFAWAGNDTLNEEGTLVDIDFRVVHGNRKDTTSLQLKNVQLFDEDGKEISVNVVDGDVKPFDGKKRTAKKNIDQNKAWKIEFNTPMNRSTLNPHTITVKDDRTGEKLPIRVSLSKDKKIVTVTSVKSYPKGSYTLTISDQIQSQRGAALKEAVQLPFTVN